MAKRQQVTKLLAVMAMTAGPAMAGPEHDHGHEHAKKAAAVTQPAAAQPAAAQPAPAPAAAASRQAAALTFEAILTMFGVTRPRELPNGRPAPGNVASRVARPRELPNGRPAPGNVTSRVPPRSEP
jgi:hypothetical protein